MDFSTFPKYKPELFEALDEVLARDIPEIMNMLPKPSDAEEGKEEDDEGENPFAEVQLVKGTATWRITAAHKAECDNVFSTLKQNNGKASGQRGEGRADEERSGDERPEKDLGAGGY